MWSNHDISAFMTLLCLVDLDVLYMYRYCKFVIAITVTTVKLLFHLLLLICHFFNVVTQLMCIWCKFTRARCIHGRNHWGLGGSDPPKFGRTPKFLRNFLMNSVIM